MTHPEPQQPDVGAGTDIDAADLDLTAAHEVPATSDPAERVDDDTELGGVGGDNAGGAG